MFRLQGISKTIDDIAILRDIALTVHAGEMIAVTGPSGSGKTTLLNIIGLMDEPTSGSRQLGMTETTSLRPRAVDRLRAAHIGFVFQDYHLMATRSVRDNVALGAVYSGLPRAHRPAAVSRLLRRVSLEHRAHSGVAVLSGGERQRVAICRALVAEPSLLLCDEPTGSLDRKNSDDIMALLNELRAELDLTVVLVTHDPAVAGHADRVLSCVDGRLAAA